MQPERPVMVTIPRFGGGGPAPPPPPPLAPGGDSAGVEAGSVESPAAHHKWHSALLDFIPAVQTAPYDLRSRPHTMLAAAWNEEVTIDEDADVLLDKGKPIHAATSPPELSTDDRYTSIRRSPYTEIAIYSYAIRYVTHGECVQFLYGGATSGVEGR